MTRIEKTKRLGRIPAKNGNQTREMLVANGIGNTVVYPQTVMQHTWYWHCPGWITIALLFFLPLAVWLECFIFYIFSISVLLHAFQHLQTWIRSSSDLVGACAYQVYDSYSTPGMVSWSDSFSQCDCRQYTTILYKYFSLISHDMTFCPFSTWPVPPEYSVRDLISMVLFVG